MSKRGEIGWEKRLSVCSGGESKSSWAESSMPLSGDCSSKLFQFLLLSVFLKPCIVCPVHRTHLYTHVHTHTYTHADTHTHTHPEETDSSTVSLASYWASEIEEWTHRSASKLRAYLYVSHLSVTWECVFIYLTSSLWASWSQNPCLVLLSLASVPSKIPSK